MKLLGPWDGEFLVRWRASPHLQRFTSPDGTDCFFGWEEPTAPLRGLVSMAIAYAPETESDRLQAHIGSCRQCQDAHGKGEMCPAGLRLYVDALLRAVADNPRLTGGAP